MEVGNPLFVKQYAASPHVSTRVRFYYNSAFAFNVWNIIKEYGTSWQRKKFFFRALRQKSELVGTHNAIGIILWDKIISLSCVRPQSSQEFRERLVDVCFESFHKPVIRSHFLPWSSSDALTGIIAFKVKSYMRMPTAHISERRKTWERKPPLGMYKPKQCQIKCHRVSHRLDGIKRTFTHSIIAILHSSALC